MKEAQFWKPVHKSGLTANAARLVQCQLCPRKCVIAEGRRGFCGVRENRKGTLQSLVYGRPCSINIDPIEKKPLFHFAPGTRCLSIATVGCNLDCSFCFLPGTSIVTNKGVLAIEEIFELGTKEVSCDAGFSRSVNDCMVVTHKGTMKPVIKAFKHDYHGDLLVIKPRYTPEITCTPSHKFFVAKSPDAKEIKKVSARDIMFHDYLVISKGKESQKQNVLDVGAEISEYIMGTLKVRNRKLNIAVLKSILKMHEEGKTSREIGNIFHIHPVHVRRIIAKFRKNSKEFLFERKSSITTTDGWVKIIREHGSGIPRYIKIDENLARILGYYCAEGHVHRYRNRPNSSNVVFSFAKHEDKYITETKKLLGEIFYLKPKIVKRRTTTTVEVSKSSLGLFIESICGRGAKDKKIPDFLLSASKEVIKAFLNAYVNGDGWIGNDVVSTNTVSRRLALGVYSLFLRLDLLPSFYVWNPKPRKKIEGRMVNQTTLYYVKLQSKMHRRFLSQNGIASMRPEIERKVFYESDKHFFVPISRITKKRYSGSVFNIEVGDEHSYTANFVAVGNCQNWEISHPLALGAGIKGKNMVAGLSDGLDEGTNGKGRSESSTSDGVDGFFSRFDYVEPEAVVEMAKANGVPGIAYTYTEPTVFFEYALDIMKLARKAGLYNVWVSNGYTSPGPARKAARYMDAINVDLKGNIAFYKSLCGVPAGKSALAKNGKQEAEAPMRAALKIYRKAGVWIETTTLVIPGKNDKPEVLEGIVKWVKSNLGAGTPMHFSRFFPHFRLKNIEPTPVKTLETAAVVAKKAGMKYVYVGNVAGGNENTVCPKCGAAVIERRGYPVLFNDKCKKCGTAVKTAGKRWTV